MAMPTIDERRARFRRLHDSGCFVLPNPWDVGSARYLQHLGFKAIASTSSGHAFSKGRPDGAMKLDEVLDHLRELVAATGLPVNADFEDGHAADLDQLRENVGRCIDTGVAGLSIEDATGDPGQPLYPIDEAVSRIGAARAAIDASGSDVLLVARAECFLTGHPQAFDEALKRLRAYAAMGADCLYAPGLRHLEQVEAVLQAVAPKPLNVLVASPGTFTFESLAALGVRRISVGGALARAAWGGFLRAAKSLAEGRFDGLADSVPHADLNRLFGEWPGD